MIRFKTDSVDRRKARSRFIAVANLNQ